MKIFGSMGADLPVNMDVNDAGEIFLTVNIYGDSTVFEDTTFSNLTAYQILKLDAEGNFIKTLFVADAAAIDIYRNDLYTCYSYKAERYNSDLNLIWSVEADPPIVNFSNTDSIPPDIYVNDNGKIVFSGIGTLIPDSDSHDFNMGDVTVYFGDAADDNTCYISMDTAGNVIHGRSVWSYTPVVARAVALDSDNNVYVATHFWSTIYFAGVFLSNFLDVDDNYPVLLKYDTLGNEVWARPLYLEHAGPSNINDIQITQVDDILFGGVYNGPGQTIYAIGDTMWHFPDNHTMFFCKLDQSGEVQWLKFNDDVDDGNVELNAIAVADDTTYFIACDKVNFMQLDCQEYFSLPYGGFLAKVTEYPLNLPGFSYSNAGTVYTFIYTGSGATSWLWDFGNGETSTLENPDPVTFEEGGSYTVTLITSNGLCDDSSTMFITDAGLAIENDPVPVQIAIYPNPTSNNIYIQIENALPGSSYELGFYDITGKLILQGELNRNDVNVLELGALSSGIYLVRVNENGILRSTEKIIKE